MIEDGGHIRQMLQQIVGTYGKDELSLEVCIVDSVDTSSSSPTQWTCAATPQSGENITQLTNVLLTAAIGSNGVIAIPAVGSVIIVGLTIRNDYYVWKTSELQNYLVYWNTGSNTFVRLTINENNNGILQFNDGSFGGIPQDSIILNNDGAIITFILALMTAITGAANFAAAQAAITAVAGSSTPTPASTQNPTIKHGIPI